MTTKLVLAGVGVPDFSARELHQTLTPIAQQGAPRRTINARLIDLGLPQFEKYASVISCNDLDPPAFEGLWRGMEVTVDCVEELGYAAMSGSPSREVVEGSQRTKDGFTWYRPRLRMMVMDWGTTEDEAGKVAGWSITLEEV